MKTGRPPGRPPILNPDISGKRFGRLVAVRPTKRTYGYSLMWLCRCDCGGEKEVILSSLRGGRSRSCGCLWRETRVLNGKAQKIHGKANSVEATLLYNARYRARRDDIPFNLELEDVIVPEICPLLGIPLFPTSTVHKYRPNSPSLDKKIPLLGYIKGNVWVISNKANMMKGIATLEEFELMARNWRALS